MAGQGAGEADGVPFPADEGLEQFQSISSLSQGEPIARIVLQLTRLSELLTGGLQGKLQPLHGDRHSQKGKSLVKSDYSELPEKIR